VECRFGSSSAPDKKDGKEEWPSLGLAPKWTGPSFAEVLRSDLVIAAKALPTMGGHHSRMKTLPAEPCALDLLAVRLAEEDSRSAVDCSTLESPPLDLLDKDQPHRPLGKKLIPRLNSKFETCARGASWSLVSTWPWAGL
jgi:hypothetical protein